VYSSKHRSRVAKSHCRHGLAPCNMGCVVCDLMAWGSGESPARKRAMASPDLDQRKAPSPGQRSSGLMESRRYPGGLIVR
jgi:hypothetical protein